MIGAILLAVALAAMPVEAQRVPPKAVTIAGATGEIRIAVRRDADGAPVLPAPALLAALGGAVRLDGAWAEVNVARQPFRFLVGAPLYRFSDRVRPLAGSASITRDTLFLPLQFVAEIVPYFLGERYRYDRARARLVDLGDGAQRVAVADPAGPAPRRSSDIRTPGLRAGHVVTVDPGHGGVDPGNPGLFFPRGTREKDVTLQVGLLLREELRRRGVSVRMTRTTDTLIALGDRGGYCSESCDLFVSLHVNSIARRRGYTGVRGFETYFLAEAKTEEAARVAKMENDAVRFESVQATDASGSGLDFILKDLQLNEHLRESARLAELVQKGIGAIHTGPSHGVKQAGFMVLTTARRPSILVEMGYSTNPEDGRFLTTRTSQRAIASSVADAVVAYLLDYERKTGTVSDAGRRR
ncbi:MAG: N-acetylmuramoyl-L-alanine amidase [Gemmatimonadales bacterium]|nr:N-acetylmuramoyl-L-alanine amidase [Gemmatimonadales bacterium]